jgi:hypothetical protein
MTRAESEPRQAPPPPSDEPVAEPPKRCTVCNSPLLTPERKPYISVSGLCFWCEDVGSQG